MWNFMAHNKCLKQKKSLEIGWFPLDTALDIAVSKIRFDIAVSKIRFKQFFFLNNTDQHLQTKMDDVQLLITYGNGMQIICISGCIFV